MSTARTEGALAWQAIIAIALVACAPDPPKAFIKSAKFGVFFGGQIEERREIPFELNAAKQTEGFRIEFTEPLTAETTIDWRIDEPRSLARRRRKAVADAPDPSEPSRPLAGTDVVHAGQTRFDRAIDFRPGDPLGLWNVRVVVRGKVVIDRPVEVFDAAARARVAAHTDGGF